MLSFDRLVPDALGPPRSLGSEGNVARAGREVIGPRALVSDTKGRSHVVMRSGKGT
jgi:hypothetical protein